MTIPLPVLLAAGAAAVILGGDKKKRKTKKSPPEKIWTEETLSGQPCDVVVGTPEGWVCTSDGILQPEIVDESTLEKNEEPTGDEAGDFEMKEEDVSVSQEEDTSVPEEDREEEDDEPDEDDEDDGAPEDISATCEEFLQAIHTVPTQDGELPINKVAANQTAIPAMERAMISIASEFGGVDAETVGPIMVQNALTDLVPVCEWKYDEVSGEFTFNDGQKIESAAGKDVLYALMSIASQLIDEFNNKSEEGSDPDASFSENQSQKIGSNPAKT